MEKSRKHPQVYTLKISEFEYTNIWDDLAIYKSRYLRTAWQKRIRLTHNYRKHHEARLKNYLFSSFDGFFCPLDHGTGFDNHIIWKGGNNG